MSLRTFVVVISGCVEWWQKTWTLGGLRVRALVISCAAFETKSPSFSPPHIIAHPARKSIADDKKIPTNNDHSFVGAFHMYTNDIASFWISLAVPRLLMYLFDHIWIIGLPIGPLLNKWVTCLVWLMSVKERKKEREKFVIRRKKENYCLWRWKWK